TTMGPLHSPVQKAFVQELIEEAKESGAQVLEFGELPGGELEGGNFVGPTIPILPFETEEQAIQMANDTWSGLCGSVWTADADRANRVGGQLVCGYVWVNDHGATRLDLRAP